VLPSMSVKRNVTIPVNAEIVSPIGVIPTANLVQRDGPLAPTARPPAYLVETLPQHFGIN
jgi:hypothetical protein